MTSIFFEIWFSFSNIYYVIKQTKGSQVNHSSLSTCVRKTEEQIGALL